MNAVINHEQYALENLTDRVAWLALVDHHQEEFEISRRVALRAVAAMRRNARCERELAKASALLAAGSPNREHLLRALRAFCELADLNTTTVITIRGRARPVLYEASDELGRRVLPGDTILVGARFVLRLNRIRELCDFATGVRLYGVVGELLGLL